MMTSLWPSVPRANQMRTPVLYRLPTDNSPVEELKTREWGQFISLLNFFLISNTNTNNWVNLSSIALSCYAISKTGQQTAIVLVNIAKNPTNKSVAVRQMAWGSSADSLHYSSIFRPPGWLQRGPLCLFLSIMVMPREKRMVARPRRWQATLFRRQANNLTGVWFEPWTSHSASLIYI